MRSDESDWMEKVKSRTLKTAGCGTRFVSGLGLCPTRQRRFYDFNVWSRGKQREKLNYMHANPVVRKLVKHPKDWPWSSWSFYEKREKGLIGIDAAEGGWPKTHPLKTAKGAAPPRFVSPS